MPEQLGAIERAYRVTSLVHPTAAGGYEIDHSSVLFALAHSVQAGQAVRKLCQQVSKSAALGRLRQEGVKVRVSAEQCRVDPRAIG